MQVVRSPQAGLAPPGHHHQQVCHQGQQQEQEEGGQGPLGQARLLLLLQGLQALRGQVAGGEEVRVAALVEVFFNIFVIIEVLFNILGIIEVLGQTELTHIWTLSRFGSRSS